MTALAVSKDTTLTVTAKGQITLRKDLLQHLGIHAGAKITVRKLPNGRIEVEAARPRGKISDAFGMLKREGQRTVSIDEMNEVIAKGWAGEL
ncbi:AbrB/MazE/SpoVT family DNA-binding domain-containing protein [Sphingomonas lycopersici]|uniref:AbrB/MazE/SpoVT family DNA-binding domain-containing protein n=1 Tax=Sphingomonas lycopersici TaxID=2951807 RepID=A0AA41ZBD9_9SPHN|nr:AbrB/MazE/SpoVT family DNA-binding domain-containing protein [Sphingomonas lycopersici]MCW6536056.1 AbrB/MazE/SpoVT family DNA-binding domain-containing protein [Sphingomonas lycopersici]